MLTVTLPDRTWVPIAAPPVGVGASPAGFGMKAGGVSVDTRRQRIRVLGGGGKSNPPNPRPHPQHPL